MKFLITPEYKYLFDDDPKSIEKLIPTIPIETIVQICCFINSQLYFSKGDSQKDLMVLQIWLSEQPQEIKNEILKRYLVYKNIEPNGIMFVQHHILGFLHESIILNEDLNFLPEDYMNPAYQLLALKFYVHSLNKRDQKIKIPSDANENFYKRTWSLAIGQNVLNTDTYYFNTLIKSMCFFDYFQFDLNHEEEVKTFLKNTGCENGKNYAFKNLSLLQTVTNSYKPDGTRSFLFTPEKELIPLYDLLSLNLSNYKRDHFDSKNFIGLKESPVYKINGTDKYMVVNWNFFGNKIYSGLIFDFYNRSGIKSEKKNDFVSHYKPKVAKMVERHLFANLIRGIFEKDHAIIRFDEKIDNHPDAYVRIGKRIFLFEIKDALFPANAIDSENFEMIKSVIDEKYNCKNKGTGQIISQLQHLKSQSFEEKSYEELNLKPKNMIVYPIILYTDPHFGTIGFESYLNQELISKIRSNNLMEHFGKISRLAFINLDFFLQYFTSLSTSENRLDKLIDFYSKQLQKREKKFSKSRTLENEFDLHITFENVCKNRVYSNKKETNYIKEIFRLLNLLRGLD
jgi:hypothetical protein